MLLIMHQRSKGLVWFTHKAIEAYAKETGKPLYMYVPIKSYPDPMSKRKNDYRAELYDESNPLYEKLRKTDINAYCVYLTKKLPDPPEGGHISFYDIGGIHVFNRMDSRYGCDVFEPVLREEKIER